MKQKLEFDLIYQISDVVDDDLSRIELLFEFYYPIMKNINFIAGYEREEYFEQESGYSYFFSIGYKNPLIRNYRIHIKQWIASVFSIEFLQYLE